MLLLPPDDGDDDDEDDDVVVVVVETVVETDDTGLCRLNFLDGWYCPVISFSAATSTLYPDCLRHVDKSLSVKSEEEPTNIRNICNFSGNDDDDDVDDDDDPPLLLPRFAMIDLTNFGLFFP